MDDGKKNFHSAPQLLIFTHIPKGGGIGALTNYLGLGADRVHQLKVVTPDGVLRTVNACQNPDLFFAMRGGGPGLCAHFFPGQDGKANTMVFRNIRSHPRDDG